MDRQMTTTEILDMLRGQLERDKTYERELEIQKVEARERIEKLKFLLKEREERIEKLKERIETLEGFIKKLESRPTLAQQGRMLEDLNMLQAKLNEREERIRAGKAENEKLRSIAIDADLKAHGRELKLERETKEAKQKLEFWKGWGIVIGMMIANVIWWVSLRVF